jgi:tetratricopeptide (TPR) repeat protein
MREALGKIRRALADARNIKSTTRVGFALVTLANWRVSCALARSKQQNSMPGEAIQINRSDPECLRLLWSAKAATERALQLTGIDAETECAGQIALTAIYYHLGDLEQARNQVQRALEESHQSEMMHLVGRAQRLQAEIQLASCLEKEADISFNEALQTCKEYNLHLDYARTLHRYGQSLLARSLHVKSAHGADSISHASLAQKGFDYLCEARDIFTHCQASLDLQWVEETLKHSSFRDKEIMRKT